MKNLKSRLPWTNVAVRPIYIAYFSVLVYLSIWRFSWLMVAYLGVSFVIFMTKNTRQAVLKLGIILLVFASICTILKKKEERDFNSEPTVAQLTPILDTITVNGDSIGFRARSAGKTYQVYYQAPTQEVQLYFKSLSSNVNLSVVATTEKAATQRNFNGFDYQAYLKTQSIYRVATIQSIKSITAGKNFDLHVLRRRAILFCESNFPKPMSAYMTGLLFGYLGKDFDEMGSIYTSLGIMHLFALSGMQVSFFVDFLRKLLLRSGVRRDIVDGVQLPFSILYAGLTGFSVSVMRALIQKLLANFGIKKLDNFSLTLLILFCIMPKFLLTTGGTLSILFAFVISMFGDRFDQLPKYQRLTVESLVLSVSVLPMLLLYFHTFQPMSLILTFIFSLIFDMVLLPGLSLIFLLAILTNFKITQVNIGFQLLESLIKLTDNWLHYPLVLGKPQAIVFLLMLVLTGFLIDFWRFRKWRLLLMTPLLALFFITKNPVTSSITMVDIGQGDSIFLQDRINRHTILIDTGGRVSFGSEEAWRVRSSTPNASNTLIPYLKSQGVGSIDTLVITHTDEDHMGDLLAVIDQIKVKIILTSPGSLTNPNFVKILKQTGAKVQVAQVGQKLEIFDSYLEVLYPWAQGDGKNNDSIVLYGNLYQTKFLFTGDLEKEGEASLLTRYPKLDVDVLKAGHHGSKTSSSDAFIKAITPKIGLISCGINNRYKHPNVETLTTFDKYNVVTYRTDLQGAIRFQKQGKSWHIATVK
ncbi:DNA internalization-related competence protein ComEC/Rec2 [Lactococcus insecticola]|uniref:DNA internalization-related competence protein ComEC/Rec2 n=1 Tax=Pseudolactococcus insecticola TaxID=2709158 RepID=A0A6A0B3R6_9LACT|nr:DNA internalization-related competence protein ComEC/Rec2 [Lactococcus insecticola]GFH39686.1 DNA internalization-related competence protein ComEC/Rec2 [Lactococcus insecticola]